MGGQLKKKQLFSNVVWTGCSSVYSGRRVLAAQPRSNQCAGSCRVPGSGSGSGFTSPPPPNRHHITYRIPINVDEALSLPNSCQLHNKSIPPSLTVVIFAKIAPTWPIPRRIIDQKEPGISHKSLTLPSPRGAISTSSLQLRSVFARLIPTPVRPSWRAHGTTTSWYVRPDLRSRAFEPRSQAA
jgi:hypothetical protein